MKNFIYSCYLVLLFSCSEEKEVDYIKEYYPFTNDAEQSILDKDFKNALQLYKKGFSNVNYIHSVDLYNAMQCAMRINKFEDTESIAKILFQRGLHLSKIKESNSYNSLPKEQKERIAELFRTIFEKEGYSYSIEQRNYFENLVELDQKFRTNGDYNFDPYLQAKVDSIDQIVLHSFFSFVKENGYPKESDIGLGTSLLSPVYDVILLHYAEKSQLYSTLPNFSEVLKIAIRKGEVRPSLAFGYLNFFQHYNNEEVGFPLFFKIGGERNLYFMESSNDSLAQSININRLKWGLPTIENQKEIVYQSYQQDYSDFVLNCDYCVFNIGTFASNEDSKNFLSSMKVYGSENKCIN